MIKTSPVKRLLQPIHRLLRMPNVPLHPYRSTNGTKHLNKLYIAWERLLFALIRHTEIKIPKPLFRTEKVSQQSARNALRLSSANVWFWKWNAKSAFGNKYGGRYKAVCAQFGEQKNIWHFQQIGGTLTSLILCCSLMIYVVTKQLYTTSLN